MPIACLTSLIIDSEIDKAFSAPSINVFSTNDLSFIILLYSSLKGLKKEVLRGLKNEVLRGLNS